MEQIGSRGGDTTTSVSLFLTFLFMASRVRPIAHFAGNRPSFPGGVPFRTCVSSKGGGKPGMLLKGTFTQMPQMWIVARNITLAREREISF